MKSTIFIVIAAIIAFFAYKHFNTTDEASTLAVDKTAPVEPTPTSTPTQPADDAFKELITTAPAGADVFILEPGDGSTVSSPVTIKFGITNMVVAKAGDDVENSGHHHLLLNLDELPPMNAPLPATEQIIHFGGAQTETTIDLEPGQHTLQLLLGNYLHIPHDKPVLSKKITITVE